MAERKIKPAEVTEPVKQSVTVVPEADPAPAPARTPASATSVASPLEAPPVAPVRVDATQQMAPPNATAPHAAANDTSVRLIADGGAEVSVEDLFEYPTMQNPGALVRVTQRVYRESVPMGSKTKVTQLMYPQGAMISIFEAQRVKAEMAALAKANSPQE